MNIVTAPSGLSATAELLVVILEYAVDWPRHWRLETFTTGAWIIRKYSKNSKIGQVCTI